MGAEVEDIKVESTLKKHRGLSANNPYLQPSPLTYSYQIQPAEVAESVIQTVLLLASEWSEDLQIHTAESVWRSRRAQVTGSDEEIRQTMPAFSIAPGEYGSDSPFRSGNYDLLQAISTRQAIKATLASYKGAWSGGGAHMLLADYCAEQGDVFAGKIELHAADKFIAGLLELPIVMRMGLGGGKAGDGAGSTSQAPSLVDPVSVCEVLLEWRESVGEMWVERLARLPDEILEVKREHLEISTAAGRG